MSQNPKSTSDEIRIIHAKQQASDWVLLIQAIARALVSLAIIATGAWLMATGREIPQSAWNVALLVLGGLFGIDALEKWSKRS
jgi:thiol:disulfide interchange protein